MRNKNNFVSFVVAVVASLLLVSCSTALPIVNVRSINNVNTFVEKGDSVFDIFEKEFNYIADNFDEFIEDEQFLKVRSIAKQTLGTDVFGEVDSQEIVEVTKSSLKSISMEDVIDVISSVKKIDSVNATKLLKTLIRTILAEFFVYVVFYSNMHSIHATEVVKLFFSSVIINTITNPVMNIVYQYIYKNVIVLESIVVVVESFMIFRVFHDFSLKTSVLESIILSLLANSFSFAVASNF